MDYRWLGQTGIRISRFGVGTGAFPERGAPRHGARLLVEAAGLGVTFWDTANSYDTYREIRMALASFNSLGPRVVISSKIEAKTHRGARRQIRRCLDEIGRSWVDAMLLHYVQEPLSRWRGALEALREAKARGEILAIGLSTHNPHFVDEAIRAKLDCVFVTLNMAGTWREGTRGNAGMIAACQRARRAGLGVVILKVLGCGALVPRRVRALRWARSRVFADGVIVGVESVRHLREDLAEFESPTGQPPRPWVTGRAGGLRRARRRSSGGS